HVGSVVVVVRAPCAGLGGVVEDRVATGGGVDYGVAVGEVALQLGDAERVEFGVVAAVEARHVVTACAQAAAQGLAEEAATAGYEDFHAGILCGVIRSLRLHRAPLLMSRASAVGAT